MKLLFLVPTLIMVSCGSAAPPTATQPTAMENTIVLGSESPAIDSLPAGFWGVLDLTDGRVHAEVNIDENYGFWLRQLVIDGDGIDAYDAFAGSYSLTPIEQSDSLILTLSEFCGEVMPGPWRVTAISSDQVLMFADFSYAIGDWQPTQVELVHRQGGVPDEIQPYPCDAK